MKFSFGLIFFVTLLMLGCGSSSSQETKSVSTTSKFLTIKRGLSRDVPIAINQKISLIFDTALNPKSVNNETVYILDDANNTIGVILELKEPFTTVTLTPYEFFKPSSHYTIVVTTELKSSSGLSLSEEYHSTFTTDASGGDSSPFVIRAVKPDKNSTSALVQTDIVIDFNKNLSIDPAYRASELLKVTDNNGTIIHGSYEVFNSLLKFKPSTPLPYDANISVELVGTVSDIYGTPFSGHPTWSFQTRKNLSFPIENDGFASLNSFESNKSASIVRKISDGVFESKIAVANGNKIDFYKVHYTHPPTKPTLSFIDTLTLGSQINAMCSFSDKFLLVGTMESGVYVINSTTNTIQNYLPSKTIYGVSIGVSKGVLDRAYAVGPNFGLEVFDLNSSTGVLAKKFFVDTNVTGEALDVLDATFYDQHVSASLRQLYIADYRGSIVVLDENGSFLLKSDLNGSVKKLAFQADYSGPMGIFAISSSGRVQGMDLNGSIKPFIKMDLTGEATDVSYYMDRNDYVSTLYYTQGLDGILITQDDYSEGIIDTGGDVVSSTVVKGSLPPIPFLVTLNSDGALHIFNAMKDYGSPTLFTTPSDGESDVDLDAMITLNIEEKYLDTSTISKNSFTFVNDTNGTVVPFHLSLGEGMGNFYSYSLIPDVNLTADNNYTVVVDGNISDMLGNKLNSGADTNISFTTTTN